MRLLCKGKSESLTELTKQFNEETKDGKDMKAYNKLLGDAIKSIINVKESSDIQDFLKGAAEPLFLYDIKGLDDFELITFLVIK